MRAVVQRVSQGKVSVEGFVTGHIQEGMVILLGIAQDDTTEDVAYLADKILNLRIFNDKNGKMNLSIRDVCGSMLIVSQFTLYGDCRKGRRPSYSLAASPEKAKTLYLTFIQHMKDAGIPVETGVFKASMQVEIHNEGPVTLLLDSKNIF